jgi:hypothetical protein
VRTLVLTALFLTAAACGGAEEDDATIEPTLASIQKNVFDRSCASSSCHGEAQEGELDLRKGKSLDEMLNVDPDNPAALAAGLKLITPGDPQKSFLYTKLLSVPEEMGQRMPTGSRPLSTAKINAIKTWIEDGASK